MFEKSMRFAVLSRYGHLHGHTYQTLEEIVKIGNRIPDFLRGFFFLETRDYLEELFNDYEGEE